MSAGRNASTLLISLVGAVILFFAFAGVSSLNALEQHAYMPDIGWEQPKVETPEGIIGGVCAPTKATNGFPLAYSKQADLPHNCQKATNPLARSMNYALYFATAAIIAVGAASRLKGLRV